ncbi:hypothetical protein Tco_0979325 [Tanacetum coccineum]
MEVEEELPEPWILFTDGSSYVDGSRAGLILTNPEGAEFTYALRFRFEETNNELEYEALIAGLRIAKEMGVKNLQANMDSRLVANQVNRTYIAKEADMIRYLEKALKSSCDGCWIAKSWITCVNTNGNTTLSKAQEVPLQITSGVRFRRRPPAKVVGLRVADFHTGNHLEDDFTPLETIRRPYSVIRKRIPFELEWETFEPEKGVHISRFNPFGMIKLATFAVMCKAYGGEPFVDLLRSFLNLGHVGDWLTLSNRGGADVPKALIKPTFPDPILYLAGLKTSWKCSPKRPVIYYRRQEIDFRNFITQGVDGEFNFLPKGGFNNNQGSLSAKSVNNETPIIDAEPISTVLPSNVADNIIDSSNTSFDAELPLVHPSTSSFPEVSKVAGDASTPLNDDSDPNIHGKFKPVYGVFVPSLTTLLMSFPFLLQYLKDIGIEQLCDIHDRAYMRQAVLDNMLNSRTRELISALHKSRASYDAIREKEIKRDKAYAELEKKCNESL